MAAVEGLSARKAAIAERLSRLALEEQWWPTLARLRCFRGVDTLTAFALHLELGGDRRRFKKAVQRGDRRLRTRTRVLPLGRRHSRLTPR